MKMKVTITLTFAEIKAKFLEGTGIDPNDAELWIEDLKPSPMNEGFEITPTVGAGGGRQRPLCEGDGGT